MNTLNRLRAAPQPAPTVISTRWSIRSPLFRSAKLPEVVSTSGTSPGAEMQKLHLKVRNLPIRNLQMRMPGVSSPDLPPLVLSRIPLRVFLSIRVPQVVSEWRINCYRAPGEPPLRFQPHPVRTGRFQMSQRRTHFQTPPTFTARWDGRWTGVSGLVGPACSRRQAFQMGGKVAKK
jgi:hypothetical protein